MKQNILGTGLSGLVGSRIVALLSDSFEFEDLSYDTGVDITNRDQVAKKIGASSAKWILHLAAKADVDGCEADKAHGREGAAWKINVEGTGNIVEAATRTGKRVLYISTDFVFDGTKDFYTEEDTPHPINWYAKTKYEGEQLVLSRPDNIVARITYPYCAKNGAKKDFVHAIINRLQKKLEVTSLTDHIFTPTLIDDIATSIKLLMEKDARGIYHLVGNESLSPFEATNKIAEVFGLDTQLFRAITMAEYFQNRAPRPYKLATKNDRITGLGVRMRSFSEGLLEIKKQGISQ